MALVSQEVALFDDTILANIAYGRPGAGEAEIIAAAEGAAASAFIQALPQGYQTRVGENGVKLSGRPAPAHRHRPRPPARRADPAARRGDLRARRRVGAHRSGGALHPGARPHRAGHRPPLSTIVNADLIYVLDQGRVAESGNHAELMRKGGLYSRLYGMQATEAA